MHPRNTNGPPQGGPLCALALLRDSLPVGFELSLLQRQDCGVKFLNLLGDGRPLLQKHPAALVEVTQRNHHMQVLLLCRLLLGYRRLKQLGTIPLTPVEGRSYETRSQHFGK